MACNHKNENGFWDYHIYDNTPKGQKPCFDNIFYFCNICSADISKLVKKTYIKNSSSYSENDAQEETKTR